MCYSAPISLVTYVIGIAGCARLLTKRDYVPEAVFYGWTAHMQLIDFFVHMNPTSAALRRTFSV